MQNLGLLGTFSPWETTWLFGMAEFRLTKISSHFPSFIVCQHGALITQEVARKLGFKRCRAKPAANMNYRLEKKNVYDAVHCYSCKHIHFLANFAPDMVCWRANKKTHVFDSQKISISTKSTGWCLMVFLFIFEAVCSTSRTRSVTPNDLQLCFRSASFFFFLAFCCIRSGTKF